MAKKYKMVRLPEDVYGRYKRAKRKMEMDIFRYTGKNVKMSMPKVFDVYVNPDINKSWVNIELSVLSDFARRSDRRGRR